MARRVFDSDRGGMPPRSDVSGLHVLSINLCVLISGMTNRHIPKLAFAATLTAVSGCALALWSARLISWKYLFLFPLAGPIVGWFLGALLSRVLGLVLSLFGFNDFKRQRLELFLKFLREWDQLCDVDVICVQECFSGLLCAGRYPAKLAKGAAALGYRHAVIPSRCPSFPACLGLNSGLLILSRRPIIASSVRTFGMSLEAGSVNRGALHAELEGGVHVFTCHVSPCADVAGPFASIVGGLYAAARRRQVSELAAFVRSRAPQGSRAIVAGDFNLDIDFGPTPGDPPQPGAHAVQLLRQLAEECSLKPTAWRARGAAGSAAADDVETDVPQALSLCKPTFAYTGNEGAGPDEKHLTSYGHDGTPWSKCDDAILSRGFVVTDFREIPMVIPVDRRPHPRVTHLSDHWGVRATLKPA